MLELVKPARCSRCGEPGTHLDIDLDMVLCPQCRAGLYPVGLGSRRNKRRAWAVLVASLVLMGVWCVVK